MSACSTAAVAGTSTTRPLTLQPGEVLKKTATGWSCSSTGACGAASGDAWLLVGNAGTTPGTHFIGTLDDAPLEVRVANLVALQVYRPTLAAGMIGNPSDHGPNLVGGHAANTLQGSACPLCALEAAGRTIGGGGTKQKPNQALADYASVGGGLGNVASGYAATISGGAGSSAPGEEAAVGGGTLNVASGKYATIPGGFQNEATAEGTFAAGSRARAVHAGSFVWADGSSTAAFASTSENQLVVRASGGVGIGTATPGHQLDVEGSVRARDDEQKGYAVLGTTSSTAGAPPLSDTGLSGIAAVKGLATGLSGAPVGVWGEAASPGGGAGVVGRAFGESTGVLGVNTSPSGETVGVMGQVASADGYGLWSVGPARVDGTLTLSDKIIGDVTATGRVRQETPSVRQASYPPELYTKRICGEMRLVPNGTAIEWTGMSLSCYTAAAEDKVPVALASCSQPFFLFPELCTFSTCATGTAGCGTSPKRPKLAPTARMPLSLLDGSTITAVTFQVGWENGSPAESANSINQPMAAVFARPIGAEGGWVGLPGEKDNIGFRFLKSLDPDAAKSGNLSSRSFTFPVNAGTKVDNSKYTYFFELYAGNGARKWWLGPVRVTYETREL